MMNEKTDIRQDDMNIRVLNAVENTILEYGKRNSRHVGNVYHYFAEKLGYKSKNYLYRWFKERDSSKIGLMDVKKIIEITGDTSLADVIYHELRQFIKEG
jgi:hypothetical protein